MDAPAEAQRAFGSAGVGNAVNHSHGERKRREPHILTLLGIRRSVERMSFVQVHVLQAGASVAASFSLEIAYESDRGVAFGAEVHRLARFLNALSTEVVFDLAWDGHVLRSCRVDAPPVDYRLSFSYEPAT